MKILHCFGPVIGIIILNNWNAIYNIYIYIYIYINYSETYYVYRLRCTLIYCHCKEDRNGEMVGCDNKDCEHGQWFHLACLKMNTNKWYFPDCHKLPQITRKKQGK